MRTKLQEAIFAEAVNLRDELVDRMRVHHQDPKRLISCMPYVASEDQGSLDGMLIDDETGDTAISAKWVSKGYVVLFYTTGSTCGLEAHELTPLDPG